ncbi:hypothetical protein D915_007993 [Fasciola hepatica]|uniref:Uncharacterized protein n=1 Tax=Fasciola hepatica TaxID=6192 RepID=A0A4E0RIR6_FASHE|nr:hypothetical protein D915_007993 [Fasciola hepatica]
MDSTYGLSQDFNESEAEKPKFSTQRPMGLIALLCEVSCSIVLVSGVGLVVTGITLSDALFRYTDPFDTGLAPFTVAVGFLGCLVLIASVFGIAAMFTENHQLLFLVCAIFSFTN